MDGYKSKYLFYEANKQSMVTIPKSILDAVNLNWEHKDDVYIVFKEIEGQPGLFLYKREEKE